MKSVLMAIMVIMFGTLRLNASQKAMVTLKWIDEEGGAVSNIEVSGNFEGDVTRRIRTDTNGICVFEGKTYDGVMFYCTKPDGYYYSQGRYDLRWDRKQDKWVPWNPTVTTIVRKIVSPIPMYAKKVETSIPRTNVWFGYDLMVGDWVNPAGKGQINDLLFRIDGFWRNYRDNDSTLGLMFAQAMDGLLAVKHDMFNGRPIGSIFIMPREAPFSGYSNKWQWRLARKQIDDSRQDESFDEMNVEGRDYIFRIRSMTNEMGVVTNAFHGKIHGDIEFGGASDKGSYLKFTYFLNPTPNDRNLEFDPKRNLFTNLKSTEQVTAP